MVAQPGLPGAQRAVEDKEKWGLGFIPGIPNEWDEENGAKSLFEAGLGAQGIECGCPLGYPSHKTRGCFHNCSWPHPLPIPALFSASSRAGMAGHTMPAIHLAPFSLHRPGLGFCGISLCFFFLFFEISTLDTEGQADPLLLYVNASHNVQAMV